MQNENMITKIREGGVAQGASQIEARNQLLQQELGFRAGGKAEYALITSCFNPYLEPQDMKAFAKLLEYYEVDYTLLPKEYCCGDPFFLHAIDEKHEGDLSQADDLAREFFEENLKQVRQAGASKILAYCAGCEMIFQRTGGDISEQIMWHPTLLAQLFKGGKLELKADYYSGCHRYRKALNITPDLDSVLAALNRIEGLELNHLDSSLCCMNAEQIESLVPTIKHKTIITPCSGCTLFLRKALAEQSDYRVFMLSEVLWAVVDGHPL
ncbi:MAG: (Fe-S)-binding protein [Chloroflexi bacterium]|jgi:Fe-S oxidoreductase|nr:(Fe-S)-binding protein [Chloroflexota bacterium]